MKKTLTIIFILLLIVIGLYIVILQVKPQTNIKPIVTSTPSASEVSQSQKYCSINALQSVIQFEGAAGSVYGTLAIQNISDTACTIIGNNYIQPIFSASTITVAAQGDPGSGLINLNPKQAVYSRVRYPNGPQCQNGVVQDEVSFMYKISLTDTVLFHSDDGKTLQKVNACKADSEKTVIQVWSLAADSSIFDSGR